MVVDARYESSRVDGKIIDIAVQIAIGIDSEGYRHVLGIDTAWSETAYSWDRFIGGLKERGLRGIRLVTSDDHPGIYPAIKKHYPGVQWQRCQRHFSVNAMDLVPKSKRDDLYKRLMEAWDCEKYEDAKAAMDKIAEDYQDKYPAFSEFISEHSWETLGVYLASSPEHYKRLRTTNMLERVNQELKRRSRVVRILPNPKSCLRLFSALLKEWHEDWVYGRKYLNMDLLEKFEANKRMKQNPPEILSVAINEKKNNRGLRILQKKSCITELCPEKTRIVYCKDSNRKGDYENHSFDFLGYTFRLRSSRCKNGRFFVSFSPSVSQKSLKAMRSRIKQHPIIKGCYSKSIESIACILNPIIQGWINYYGRFRKSSLSSIFHYINDKLTRWVMRKYKSLHRRRTWAGRWLKNLYLLNPDLFAHWKVWNWVAE